MTQPFIKFTSTFVQIKVNNTNMKNLKIAGIALLAFFLNSCLGDDNGSFQEPEPSGWISFINASPDSEELKFYIDGDMKGSAIDYGQFMPYFKTDVGNKVVSVKSGSTLLDELNLNITDNVFFGVYAVNMGINTELIAYNDNHNLSEDPLKAVFRFMQLSHNIPRVRLEFEGIDGDFGDYDFKESSEFQEIPSLYKKDLYLIDNVTNDTILTKEVTLSAKKSYVIFSKGDYTSTNEDSELDLQVISFQ